MPKRKRSTKYSRTRKRAKRALYRRRKSTARVTSYQKQPGFSDAQIVRLRYADRVTLDAGATAIAFDTWSATSIYDPYVATGGHQPLCFDQWAGLYNHYTVLGAKCKVTFTTPQVTTPEANHNVVCYLGLKANTNQSVPNIVYLMEQGKFKHKMLTGATGISKCTLTKGYSPRKFFGIRNPRDDSDIRSQTSGNPVEQAYFEVGVGSTSTTANPGYIEAFVVIDYLVLFTEPRIITAS